MNSVSEKFVRVSSRNPHYFELSDGSTYLPVGVNMCFPRYLTGEEAVFADYRKMMTKFSGNGGNYIRLWLSCPFFELEPERAGVFDESRRRRLERLLDLAGSLGIKVKITLEHFRMLDPANGMESYPGAACFVKKIHNRKFGGSADTMLEFFTGEASHRVFLAKLDYLAEYFRDNPNVFSWELWNEINAVGMEEPLFNAWTQWSVRMISELKKRFPHHMAGQNIGSFDSLSGNRIYDWLCKESTSDFIQAHRYIDPGAELEVCRGPMDLLCADVVRELRERNATAPALHSEAGATEWRHSRPSHLYQLDKRGMLLHDALFAPFFAGAAGCGQFWHWDMYLEKHDLWWHFGRFGKAVAGIDPVREEYVPFRRESSHLRIYGLAGRTHFLLWCRDKWNTYENELDQEMAPERLHGIVLNLRDVADDSVMKIEYYLPWEDVSGQGMLPDGGFDFLLPDFERSIVLKLSRRPETKTGAASGRTRQQTISGSAFSARDGKKRAGGSGFHGIKQRRKFNAF